MTQKSVFTFEIVFATVVLGQVVLVLALFIYWTFIDIDPPRTDTLLEVRNLNGAITTDFRQGDTMIIVRDSCALRAGRLFYTRSMISTDKGITYAMPSSELFVKEGCRRGINYAEIPMYLPPGKYDYLVSIRYRNNPLHEGTIDLPKFSINVTEYKLPKISRRR